MQSTLVGQGWLGGVWQGSALVLAKKHVAELSGPFACRGKELGDLIGAGRCSRSVPRKEVNVCLRTMLGQ